jgi:hypothetical protein
VHLRDRDLPRRAKLFFVRGRASADNVADAGEEILEDVGAEYSLAGDDPEVALHSLSFDNVCSNRQHFVSPG